MEHWRNILRNAIGGRAWLVATDALAASTDLVRSLRELGATDVFALGGNRGTGPLPELPSHQVLDLGVRGRSVMKGLRAVEAAFANLPAHAVEALERWDPAGAARYIGSIFAAGHPIAGRTMLGARPAAWQALEDKTTVDALWDAAAVRRAPSVVVAEPTTAALRQAAHRLDGRGATVWTGDMREGFNGGAEYVRWPQTSEEEESAARFFARHCDRVRVMPFLEGIPCSIHGMVLGDQVIALRPAELIVLRSQRPPRLRYAGVATHWEPAAADTEAMRAVARRVGLHLQATVGYRGAFTVDGVLTREGFVPTELNPRVGAALLRLTAFLERAPITLLNAVAVEGVQADWQADALERLLIAGSRQSPAAGIHIAVPGASPTTAELPFSIRHGRCIAADEGDCDGTILRGPSPAGAFVRVVFNPGVLRAGAAVSPHAAAALGLADQAWQLGLGPLQAAPSVR